MHKASKTIFLQLTNHSATDVIFNRFNSLLGINEKGEVTIGSIRNLNTCSEVLASYIDFSTEVVERQRHAITQRAVLDAKKKGSFNIPAILATIEERQKEYLRRPIRKFVFLTSASFHFSPRLTPIKIKRSTLTFSGHRPKGYPLPDGGSVIVKDNTPHDYCYVKAHVLARDPYEAADRAFEIVDLLRAIWNLYYNFDSSFRITLGSSGYQPINKILPGPLHTLHFPDGKLALEGAWWYTLGAKDASAERVEQHYDALRRFERVIRKRISVCRFQNQLDTFLIRYARALDDSDMSTSFLRLWALLEEITGTTKASYEVTVRRASFVFKDFQYARIILGYLRDYRNRIVHKGDYITDAENLTYELKEYVEALLRFLLAQSHRFVTLQEFHTLLDLPPNPAELAKRIRQHKLARKLRRR